jgi:bacterioferritin
MPRSRRRLGSPFVQGDPQVLELLNQVLTSELTAINQYFIHAKMCDNWGYDRLAEYVRHESIDEMKHAERLIDRILFLEGVPNMQRIFPVRVGETVREQFDLDLAVELEAVIRLNAGIAICVGVGDNTSRALLEEILVGEEEHADWLETQLEAMRQVGEQNYLAQQLHG